MYNMKLLFEQRLNGLQLILALGHARHSLGQTEIHKKHLRLGLAAIWHNHNVLVVQIVDQNLAAMHLPPQRMATAVHHLHASTLM